MAMLDFTIKPIPMVRLYGLPKLISDLTTCVAMQRLLFWENNISVPSAFKMPTSTWVVNTMVSLGKWICSCPSVVMSSNMQSLLRALVTNTPNLLQSIFSNPGMPCCRKSFARNLTSSTLAPYTRNPMCCSNTKSQL